MIGTLRPRSRLLAGTVLAALMFFTAALSPAPPEAESSHLPGHCPHGANVLL